MRFFHLSDLHIGLKLMNHDLGEDQRHVFRQVIDYAAERKPDAVVIAGDIYDKTVPSAEALELFNDFITALTAAVPQAELMIISGNHDSGERLGLFRHILEKHRIHMIGIPPRAENEHMAKVTTEDVFGPVHFWLLPFVKPSMVRRVVAREDEESLSYEASLRRLFERESINSEERNVLVSHQFYVPSGMKAEAIERMDSELFVTVGNVDAVSGALLKPFDYAALGHIHKPMKVGTEVYRYCGTPLVCSVSEAGQQKGVLEVTLGEKGNIGTEVLPLTPLRYVRKLKGSLEELLKQATEDYVSVTLTDNENPVDLQDRLRSAFPNMLEVHRENIRMADYSAEVTSRMAELEPFDLCARFLPDLSDEEKSVLLDIVNSVKGAY